MSGFSGVVRISNVSDFIEPSQKCILPIQNNNEEKAEKKLVGIRNTGTKHIAATKNPEPKKVKVSLNDCLACSGCVTTAETVLIGNQTADQMLAGIGGANCAVVAISPQALCSLANQFGRTASQMAAIMANYFKSLGAHFVIDTSFARILSRQLHYEEFCRKFIHPQEEENPEGMEGTSKQSSNTILTGVCPGFVCYAEKTHGNLLVPRISRVRSPQAIVGRLIKDYLCSRIALNPSDIFLVCVQPCFDKKLEASRPDFSSEEGLQEVDCVLTPVELEPMLADFIAAHPDLPMENGCCGEKVMLPDEHWLHSFEKGKLVGEKNDETSGGYAHYIVNKLVEQHPNASVRSEKIASNFQVWHVNFEEVGGRRCSFSIAKAYGFRNIQNLVHRLKRDKLAMHFVEVMACPAGCHNGGGQLRAETSESRTQMSERVRELYAEIGESGREKGEEEDEEDWANIEQKLATDDANWRENAMHTNYRAIKPTTQSSSMMAESW